MHTVQGQCVAAVTLWQQLRDFVAWYRRQPKGTAAALAPESRDKWSAVLVAMSAAGAGRTRQRIASTQKKTRQISGS
ncbi:hypothetical protein BZG29_02160 [Janthinobacterium sp. LM6]|uniref:hypothetical protein n=1 Tax=Janthinobacterium sp. LM6 TaxID=1938606 RepID=UPI0009838DA5|nr:hypothetical protein [Janthinobacterium sp. LM6]AQR67292.1 hypothetical protein BZG29_02160 [Janthinobacterium sp. LM6]